MLESLAKRILAFTAVAVPIVALATSCATGGDTLGGPVTNNTGGNVGAGGSGQTVGGGGNAVAGGSSVGGASENFGTPGGGYVVTDTWHGWAWTAAVGGADITPETFPSAKAGDPLCVQGTVPSTADYSALAMLGFNLNQNKAANSDALTVTPTKAGILVSVTNNSGATLRLQIQGPNGATDANDRWCAPIPGSGTFIPYSAFNTKCWDNTGAAYNGEPLTAAIVMVPGGGTTNTPPDPDVTYDFCVNNLTESDDPNSSSAGGGCDINGAVGEGQGTITGQYDWKGVTRDSRNYVIQNNVWGNASAQQTINYSGVSFSISQQTGTNSTAGAPVSFPSVFVGSNNGKTTLNTGLPKQVSALTSVQTGWSITRGVAGIYNATYDVWFSTTAAGDQGSPSGGYLMVWFYKPPNAQPLSNNGQVSASGVSVAGTTWDVWIGTQNGKPVISYVNPQGISALSFDLNDFIKEAVGRGVIQNGWYLTNVFAGFEIWSGGSGLRTNNFCVVVQ